MPIPTWECDGTLRARTAPLWERGRVTPTETFQSPLFSLHSPLGPQYLCTPVTPATIYKMKISKSTQSLLSLFPTASQHLNLSRPKLHTHLSPNLSLHCVSHLSSWPTHPCSYLLAEIWYLSCPFHLPHSD